MLSKKGRGEGVCSSENAMELAHSVTEICPCALCSGSRCVASESPKTVARLLGVESQHRKLKVERQGWRHKLWAALESFFPLLTEGSGCIVLSVTEVKARVESQSVEGQNVEKLRVESQS